MISQTEKIASTHLGKKSKGSSTYNPDLLVAIPRIENRRQYNIDNNSLPFYGYDVWHAYEFSTLLNNGLPITKVLKIKYSCESEFIVESKSLKLYLNSFNMTKFGKNATECLEHCKTTISKDLSKLLNTKVEAEYLNNNSKRVALFDNYVDLYNIINSDDIKIKTFKENPNLIKTENNDNVSEYRLTFGSLRSNCRVTHQPDFGDIFIYYKSQKHILENSLVEYLVSFREEYHFHEECCEMIFKRLYDKLDSDDELFVCALYTRRGGIDISPARYSRNCKIEDADKILDIETFARNGIKQ